MPPVARYPSRSDAAVAILCPLSEPLGARLGENPIVLSDRAIGVGDAVATRSLGTCLEGTTALGIGLGEVQEQGGPESTDHTGLGDQTSSTRLSVTEEGSEAGGGDDGEHRSGARGGGGVSLSLEHILHHRRHLPRVET